MSQIIKKIVIVIVIVIVVFGLYLGAYLPFKQAKAFISVNRALPSVKTTDEVERIFDGVLDIGSPVASDEIRGFVLDQLTNILRTRPPEEVGKIIIGYAEEKARPVLENPVSPELTKMILKMGILYQNAWSLYRDELYAKKTEEFYLRGLEISPNRPQFLYGLFDLYVSRNERGKAAVIAETINRFWPAK